MSILWLTSFMGASAQEEDSRYDWMPVPKEWKSNPSKFVLNDQFSIGIEGIESAELQDYATRFLRRLDWKTGLFFKQNKVDSKLADASFLIKVQRKGKLILGEDESYVLKVSRNSIQLTAETDFGAMRGLETLLQLLQSGEGKYFFPGIEVKDAPRFPWRGLMIDVSRHFQPVEVIRRNIDGMAAVKLNVLHLHLVDDHGFRVESKVYPQLHQKASDGQYFAQREIKEIIRYAGERGIRVVPEFDVPGHASAFLTAFPELASAPGPYHLQNRSGIFDPTLNPIKEETYEMLNNLFTEMAALFPDTYFHIGGDENEGKHWDANPEIQAFMGKRGFTDNHELQNYFNTRILTHLTSLNKKMMGWDEILNENLPTDAVIHSWRGLGSLKKAAEAGYQCVLSNGFYIDLMKRASDHYLTDPLPGSFNLTDEAEKNILGGEATMWSELVIPETIDSRIWPRTAAIAERLWSPSTVRDTDEMYRRLDIVTLDLEVLGLQHIKNRYTLMRNLTGGDDTEPLETLLGVSEPLEGYERNPGGDIYEFHYAFNRFADVAIADAPDARAFTKLVHRYQLKKDEETKTQLINWLNKWEANHSKMLELINQSPALSEVEDLSKNLHEISYLGLQALEQDFNNYSPEKRDEWYAKAMKSLDRAKKQGARSELQVVEPIRTIVKLAASRLKTKKTSSRIKIDGELNDWKNAEWSYFIPAFNRGWKDSCHYAIQWDTKKLYFAFKVTNANIQADRKGRDESGLHKDDGVEILFDPQFDKSTEWQNDDVAYHVNVLNAILDDRGLNNKGEYNNAWNGKAKSKVQINGTLNNASDKDSGYYIEFAIDWKELGLTPKTGLSLGLNLAVNDVDDVHLEYRYFDYMNLPVFHHPAGFTELVLTD